MINNFKEILLLLDNINKELPYLSIGQLLQNALDLKNGKHNINLLDRSDKEIYTALKEYNDLTLNKCKKANVINKKQQGNI